MSGPKGSKHRSPHELCGKTCYCLWPPKLPRILKVPICKVPVNLIGELLIPGHNLRQAESPIAPIASVQRARSALASHSAIMRINLCALAGDMTLLTSSLTIREDVRVLLSEDFSLLVTFRGFFVAFSWPSSWANFTHSPLEDSEEESSDPKLSKRSQCHCTVQTICWNHS